MSDPYHPVTVIVDGIPRYYETDGVHWRYWDQQPPRFTLRYDHRGERVEGQEAGMPYTVECERPEGAPKEWK